MKRFLLMLGLVGILSVSCIPKQVVPVNEDFISASAMAVKLQSSTVAFTMSDVDTGKVYTYCTGVWVDANTILTAAHCATISQEINNLSKLSKLERENKDVDLTFRDTSGQRMSYSSFDEYPKVKSPPIKTHQATVIMTNGPHDLALLKTDKNMPTHNWMQIANDMPKQGDKVYSMGHPGGLQFVFMDGVVSSIRDSLPYEIDKDDTTMQLEPPFIQIYSGIYNGNSGGPVVSEKGEIVGIASFIMRVPNQSFAIASPALKNFVNKEPKTNKL